MTWASEVAADTPLLQWRFGDASGTSATDGSGNARPGTYTAGFTLAAGGAINDGDKAVTLNGSTGYVAGPAYTGAFAAAGQRTYEIWYKRTNHSADHVLFSASGGGTMLRLANGGQDVKWFPDTGTASTDWLAAGPGDGMWVHLVLVFDDSAHTADLYINGLLVAHKTGVATKAATLNINVGARGTTSEFFNGSLDEFAVYAGSLSAARILAHYQAGTLRPIIPTRAASRRFPARVWRPRRPVIADPAVAAAPTFVPRPVGRRAPPMLPRPRRGRLVRPITGPLSLNAVLDAAQATLTAQDAAVTAGAVNAVLDAAQATLTAQGATSTPGLVGRVLAAAQATLTAQGATAAPGAANAVLEAAQVALAAQGATVTAGAVNRLLDVAQATLAAHAATATPGMVNRLLEAAGIILAAGDVTVTAGAVNRLLDAAQVALAAQGVTGHVAAEALEILVELAVAATPVDVAVNPLGVELAVAATPVDVLVGVGNALEVNP